MSRKICQKPLSYGEKRLTRLIYSKKEDNRQTQLESQDVSAQDAAQILQLKRLLVTVKQHYEKSLQQLQIELQAEQNQRLAVQKELERVQFQFAESGQLHDEELHALRQQQTTLKEILKKNQEELALLRTQAGKIESDSGDENEQTTQLKQATSILREQIEGINREKELLREELSEVQKKSKALEEKLLLTQQQSQKEIEQLQQLLEDQKIQGDDLETVVSTTSSHYLRRELEMIKRTLIEGAKETKSLESRYIDVLNEKVELEHQCKQLQQQIENQSSNLTAFQERLHEAEERKKNLEYSLQAKEAEWVESCQQRQDLYIRIEQLNTMMKEKELIQDKYEQLKEEWKHAHELLEEAIEARMQMDGHVNQLEAIAANQETQLQEFVEQLQVLHQEKGLIESERDQFKMLLDESETRLKMAQQHLAKKVKESALLSEKIEEQQSDLADIAYKIEDQKTQIAQLQASVDLYQKQEKRLQDQLHEALKGTESQIVKWEEKYFRMYDKWQESENRVRELKAFEEKHIQMQNMLANFGKFMGGPINTSQTIFQNGQEIEKGFSHPFSFDQSFVEESQSEKKMVDSQEEKYNLFGMRHPPVKEWSTENP